MIKNILADWAVPGMHLIISDRAQTSAFWQRIRSQQEQCSLLPVPNTLAECPSWVGTLSQSFLGQSSVYWLSVPPTWAPKAKAEVLKFMNTYQGPHALWIVLDEDGAKTLTGSAVKRYHVNPMVSYKQIPQVAQLLGQDRGIRTLEHTGLMRGAGSMSLNEACSLVEHAQFVPLRLPQQSQQYLARLMPYDHSLAGLADLFFRNKQEQFLATWQNIASSYTDMFWVAFWSEQCWRAYWTCHYLAHGQSARARSMSFRLPVSFVRDTWRHQNPQKLLSLYRQLYFFDARVKKGSQFTLSELLTSLMTAT